MVTPSKTNAFCDTVTAVKLLNLKLGQLISNMLSNGVGAVAMYVYCSEYNPLTAEKAWQEQVALTSTVVTCASLS